MKHLAASASTVPTSPPSDRSGNTFPALGRWASYLNIPLIVVVGFNLLTLVVFLTAPIRWDTGNTGGLAVLVLISQSFLLAGFLRGRRAGFRSSHEGTSVLSTAGRAPGFLLLFFSITLPIHYGYLLHSSPFDVGGMAIRLWQGVLDPQLGRSLALFPETRRVIPWTLFFVISIANQLLFIVGFLEWQHLAATKKVLFLGFVVIDLFFWVGRGTGFGVISMSTTLLFSGMCWVWRKKRRPATLRTLVIALALLAGSVWFMSYILYARSGRVERDVETFDFELGNSVVLYDHPSLSMIPAALRPTYMALVSYLAQGYYHTCLAFDVEFRWTYLLGNNPALADLASLLGIDIWRDTYMHRLQGSKSIDEFMYWHSAYTWYANDVSFYGVPIVIFLLAYIFGFSWAKSVQGDFLSRIIFVIVGNMLLYLFANNTYLASMFYTSMFLFPLWTASRLLGRVSRKERRSRRGVRWSTGMRASI